MAADVVLIVDADADTREILSLALTRAGYRVIAAADGDEAVALLSSEPVSLVIADLYVRTGEERCLLRWLRLQQAYMRTPVIAYTARLSPRDYEWADEQHCRRVLAKPTSIVVIAEQVRTTLSEYSARGDYPVGR